MLTDKAEIQLISISQAARRLGISPNTLRQWIGQRRFPFIRVGGRVLISIEDLNQFVVENRVEVRR